MNHVEFREDVFTHPYCRYYRLLMLSGLHCGILVGGDWGLCR